MKRFYSLSELATAKADVLNPEHLGGKGYGLAKMAAAGYPVPPAYVISTRVCRDYLADPLAVLKEMQDVIPTIIKGLSDQFGYMPLVSVRSGAAQSMPGMMDTILNIGLDQTNENAWGQRIGFECAENSRKRLIEMYADVVCGIERSVFAGAALPECEKLFKSIAGYDFPGAAEQLIGAVEAVFKSWNTERAVSYRNLNGIPHDGGTAVTIQAMVFGNMNDQSCTGVAFSRDPSSGDKGVTGEFLINAQGEDVVAGIRTPEPLEKMSEWNGGLASALTALVCKLEKENQDAQDVEFTVQDGTLYLLQTRSVKRTAQAAIRIAMDMVSEKLISPRKALSRVSYHQYLSATRPQIDPEWKKQSPAHAVGIAASNGVAIGPAVFSSKAAVKHKGCILITEETTPDDIEGMNAAAGILTRTGGSTSHAAVVARGMDKVCVVGCGALTQTKVNGHLAGWDIEKGNATYFVKEGQTVAIDGSTGEVWFNLTPPLVNGIERPEVQMLLGMVDGAYLIYHVATKASQVKGRDKVLLIGSYVRDREALVACLQAFTGSHMVIDTRPRVSTLSADDYTYMMGFGKAGVEADAHKCNAVLMSALIEFGDPTRMSLLGLPVAGYSVIPAVYTLEDLLAVSGLCMPDQAMLAQKVGKENVKKIVELRRKAGDDLQSFNICDGKTAVSVMKKAVVAMPLEALLLSVLA